MPGALSIDLRRRVLAAVEAGASHREAAERFGVSAASASRWRALAREHGEVRSGRSGGDRRSGRIEKQAALIHALLKETSDITLNELRGQLAEQGHAFGISTLHRFFKRHGITRKKRQATPSNRTDPTS